MAAIDTATQTYTSGGQTYDAHTGAVVTPPTVPTPVAATAPSGQTSTSSAPATPTAVVSSAPAVAQAQNMGDTAIKAQADVTAQNATRAANAGKPGYDSLGNPIPTPATGVTPTTPTPEETIANTPDTGNQFIYDPSGNRTQIPVGQSVPSGFSTTNPKTPPIANVTDQVTDTVGNVYKQFADGTYGKFDATGAYQGPATAADFQTNKTGMGLLDSMNQVTNGTYPLTAAQQAQVDGIKSQFATLIAQQQTANANFTGATTVAENLYGMGNSLAGMGQIKGTVDAGISKITDLNSQLASSVAQMTAGFQTDDLNMLKDAYTIYSNTVQSRQDELDKLTAAATAAAKDARDFAETQKMDALTKMMDDNTISYQAKEQAMTQAGLDEQQKNDLFNQSLQKLQYQLDVKKENYAESLTSGTSAGSTIPAVPMTTDNVPDPQAQASFLASLPGGADSDLATQVKGLANYTLAPSDFTVRTLKGGTQYTRDQMVALAQKYDPTYSDTQFPARQNLLKNFTSGIYSQQVTALNTATGHIASLANDINKIGNVNFGPANIVKNAVLPIFGQGATTGVKTDIAAVNGELAKAFKASGATDAEIQSLGTVNANSTPADIQSYITSATELMSSKLSALSDTYTAGMGKAPAAPLMSQDAMNKLSDLKNNGYTIDIPGVNYTDKDAYVKNDPDAAANMQTAVQQLTAAGLPLTQENILQLAQSQ